MKFVILDTNAAPNFQNDGKGYLDKDRLEWFESAMSSDCKNTILLMHHAPVNSGIKFMEKFKMHKLDEFQKLVLKFPNLRHILFGHVHHAVSGNLGHISYSSPGSFSTNIKMNSDEKFLAADSYNVYGVLDISSGDSGCWAVVAHNIDYSMEVHGARGLK